MLNMLGFLLWWAMLLALLRFLTQLAAVNIYNPIIIAIVKISNPVLQPIRKFLPSYEKWDFASLATALVLSIGIEVIPQLTTTIAIGSTLINGVLDAVHASIWIFIVALVFSVIMSWVAPTNHSPISEFARQLSDFFLRPLRRLLPTVEGFDFSPMLAIFICIFLLRVVIPGLAAVNL